MGQAADETRSTAIAGGVAAAVALAALYVCGVAVVRIWPAIQLLIIASLIAVALTPAVEWLVRRRLPRPVAVIAILAAGIAVVALVAALVLPPLIRQTVEFGRSLPQQWDSVRKLLERVSSNYPWLRDRIGKIDLAGEVSSQAGRIAGYAGVLLGGAAGGIMAAVVAAVATVIMLLEPGTLARGIVGLFPAAMRSKAERVGALMRQKVHLWTRAMAVLMATVGTLVGVLLWIVGIPYAVLFGALAGVLEIVPTLGPIMAAVPPVLTALAIEPVRALYVVLVFVAINQLENNLLVPLVMSRGLQLRPVSVIVGFLVMTALFGIFGAVIAVPTVACLKVVHDEVYAPWAQSLRPSSEQESARQP